MDKNEKIDLHMHTTMSDGTDTPEEILERVKEAGITIFSVTDHDAINGCARIREIIGKNDPLFITGVEFSCRDPEGRYHILGYGYYPDAASINDIVKKGHDLRMRKVQARLDFLRDEFGFGFSDDEIRELLARNNPGKPHVAALMIKRGYAKDKDQAFELINRKKIEDAYIRPEEAIRSIADAGAIPVLAHPAFGSGDEIILGEELDARVRKLMDFGLAGLEAYYSGFSKKIRNDVLAIAEKYGLCVTAGSDYHGSNKLVRLGDTGLDDPDADSAKVRDFLGKILSLRVGQ